MALVKNISDGPRGVWSKTGLVMLELGQEADIDLASDDEKNEDWFSFDAEDEGLNGMKVADLRALAESEGVDLGDVTKKADIISAIELAREAN